MTTCIPIFRHAHVQEYMFSHARAYRNICCNMRMPETHAWGWVHVNAGAHAYIHVARETDTVTVTVIDRQTDRQTDRQSHRQTETSLRAYTTNAHIYTTYRRGFRQVGGADVIGHADERHPAFQCH